MTHSNPSIILSAPTSKPSPAKAKVGHVPHQYGGMCPMGSMGGAATAGGGRAATLTTTLRAMRVKIKYPVLQRNEPRSLPHRARTRRFPRVNGSRFLRLGLG